MDKSESIEMLRDWVYYVLKEYPYPAKKYWEQNVRRGKGLGKKTQWAKHQTDYMGITEKGFFVDSDITYAGYIDPTTPENSYFVAIYPYFRNREGDETLVLDDIRLNPATTWSDASQHKINPDGTYTYVWGGPTIYDITSYVLGCKGAFKFLNWNENPFEVKYYG
tara:strand:- start:962 stop:1456 length:495 start_codon:yes stop_codon:yes gene_type:complete